MRQERKSYIPSGEKFEEGVLRADACAERHELPRREQYRTSREDLPAASFGLSAVREERALMRDVYKLMSIGAILQSAESLEEFVLRNTSRPVKGRSVRERGW